MGPDLINPPYDSGDEADGSEEVSGEPVVSGCDASEVLEAAEGVLDAVALFVGRPVEAEGLLAVRLVGNDGFGATRAEPLSQFGAVISFVAKHLLGCFGAPDQALGWRTIVRLAAGQQDGKKTPLSICDCVDFRIAPAARASNNLALFPLYGWAAPPGPLLEMSVAAH